MLFAHNAQMFGNEKIKVDNTHSMQNVLLLQLHYCIINFYT